MRRPLGAIAIASSTLFAIVAILVATSTGWLFHVDAAVSRAALTAVHADPSLLSTARVVTQLGNPVLIDLAALALATAAAVRRQWRLAAVIAVARLGGLLVEYLVKIAIDRPRPQPLHPVAHALGASFPSGHSVGAATIATLVAVAALGQPRPRPWLAAVAALAALGVAASRVLLGVHYLSDVIAGLALGLAATTAVLVSPLRPPGRDLSLSC